METITTHRIPIEDAVARSGADAELRVEAVCGAGLRDELRRVVDAAAAEFGSAEAAVSRAEDFADLAVFVRVPASAGAGKLDEFVSRVAPAAGIRLVLDD